jgi:hypothetical protein
LRNFLVRLQKEEGKTILLSSHLLDELQKIVTHVAILHEGLIRFQGRAEELTGGAGTLEGAFLKRIETHEAFPPPRAQRHGFGIPQAQAYLFPWFLFIVPLVVSLVTLMMTLGEAELSFANPWRYYIALNYRTLSPHFRLPASAARKPGQLPGT